MNKRDVMSVAAKKMCKYVVKTKTNKMEKQRNKFVLFNEIKVTIKNSV